MGTVVVIQDLTDPHKQEFLRGHDEEISALAISSSGTLVASGQAGSTFHKGDKAPVLVWDLSRRSDLFQLDGMTGSVLALAFSPDERYLAALGQNNVLYIWDMQSGEVVVGTQYGSSVGTVKWIAVDTSSRRPSYTFMVSNKNLVEVSTLRYDVACMKYVLSKEVCGLPSSGLIRDYKVACVDPTERFVVLGTDACEFCVFSVTPEKGYMFRHNQPAVGKGGITSLAYCRDLLFVGSGDGTLAKYRGEDRRWFEEDVWELSGAVVSLSPSADQRTMLAGTDGGNVYVVDIDSADSVLKASSHIAPVVAVGFGLGSEIFATASRNGHIRAWDLGEYRVVMEAKVGVGHEPVCVTVCTAHGPDSSEVLTGWKDGFVRSHRILGPAGGGAPGSNAGDMVWGFQAHQSAVTSVVETAKFIATAGEEG